MNLRKSTVEAIVDVVKLLVHAKAPLSALDIVHEADVAEPSVRHYLLMLETRGLIVPIDHEPRVEGRRGRASQRWEWAR